MPFPKLRFFFSPCGKFSDENQFYFPTQRFGILHVFFKFWLKIKQFPFKLMLLYSCCAAGRRETQAHALSGILISLSKPIRALCGFSSFQFTLGDCCAKLSITTQLGSCHFPNITKLSPATVSVAVKHPPTDLFFPPKALNRNHPVSDIATFQGLLWHHPISQRL